MNGRKARALGRQRQQRNARWLAEALQTKPVLVDAQETFELWQRGRYTFLLPAVSDDLPDELKQGLVAYRTATLDGVCPSCEVEVSVSRKGVVATRHEEPCPGHPDRLVETGARLGVEITRRD